MQNGDPPGQKKVYSKHVQSKVISQVKGRDLENKTNLTPDVACSQVWLWDAESCVCPWADGPGKFSFDLNWLQFFQVSSKILINDKKIK